MIRRLRSEVGLTQSFLLHPLNIPPPTPNIRERNEFPATNVVLVPRMVRSFQATNE